MGKFDLFKSWVLSKPKWMVVGSIVIVLILFSAVLITGVIPTYGDERIVVDLEGLEIYSIDLTIEQYFNEGVTDEFSFFELLMDQIDEEGVIFVVHISFSVAWQDEDDIQQGVRYWENQGDCFMIDAKDEQGVIDAQAQEYNSPLNNCLIYIDWHGDFTGSCFSLGDFGNYKVKDHRVIMNDEIHVSVTMKDAGDYSSYFGYQDINDDGNDAEIYLRMLYHTVP